MHIVRMVDAIHCAEFITGGEQRINRLRLHLCSLITESIKYPDSQTTTSNKILEAVVAATYEFRIACALHKLNSGLMFNKEIGPDFILNETKISFKIEVKSKIYR
jgi:hypothetical protein